MNPYKAALKISKDFLLDEQHDGLPKEELAMNTVVAHELEEWADWITAEDAGLEPHHILNAHEFFFEGGASGTTECALCDNISAFHTLITDRSGRTRELFLCHNHLDHLGKTLRLLEGQES